MVNSWPRLLSGLPQAGKFLDLHRIAPLVADDIRFVQSKSALQEDQALVADLLPPKVVI